jgi:hypothetical protein
MIDQLLWLTSVFFWVHNLNSCHMIIPDVTLSCKYLSQILVSFSCQVTWWSCLGNFRTQNSCFNHVLARLLNLRVKPHVQALGVWNCSIRKTNKNFVIWILIPNEPSLDTATFLCFFPVFRLSWHSSHYTAFWCSATCCIVDWGSILSKPGAWRFTFTQSIIWSEW